MSRVLVALPLAAVLVAAALPTADAARREGSRAAAPAVCEQMTPERMLENPALASQWSGALRSGDEAEVARVKALFEHIRSAHGCAGEIAMPDSAPAPAAPRLPPGHPPIAPGERPPTAMTFEGPGVVTI